MRTFIIAVALVGSCLAVPQTFEKKVDYEVPSGKVSFSRSVPVEGVYGQFYGEVQPSIRYGQGGVKPLYAESQSVVKPVVLQPVQQVQPVGVKAVEDKFFGGFAQPAVRYGLTPKVIKPVVPYVAPETPVVNKYVAEARISQPVAPVFHHVSPVVQQVTPVVQNVAPVVQHVAPFSYPKAAYPVVQPAPYVQPFFKPFAKFASPVVQPYAKFASPVVQPYAKFASPVVQPYANFASPVVQPYAKFASPVVQPFAAPVATPVARVGYVAPAVPAVKYAAPVTPVVQPVAKYGPVAPAYHQGVVVKAAESPVAILAQSQDSTVDGSFVANFQTENGIQSTVSGAVKPVVGSDNPAQVMSGSYSYTAPDGTPIITNWYADENGFHADGEHIPAVPEEIQRSLEYVHSFPAAQEEFKYVKQY